LDLTPRQKQGAPTCGDLTVEIKDVELPLCRLHDTGDPDRWGFALYTDNTGRYEDTMLPTGHPVGTPEKALDWSCGLYLGARS
jgi:hypothetical protein